MQQLSLALDHLGKSMADARHAIWDLRSPEFSELKIDRAVEAAAQRLCAGGPHLTFETSGKPKVLPHSIEKQAYRIAVEAVTNAVRHSACSDVTISVEYQDESIALIVTDNGCGFDTALAQSASISNHWGLAGMQQRAEECNGRLSVQSTIGKGTNIAFEAPLGGAV
jgi:signal transduction histidine kinase